MTIQRVVMELPDTIVDYALPKDPYAIQKRNAMIVYPYIQDGRISHGKAAELLGMHKLDLIKIYSDMGFPYIDMTDEEFEDEIRTVKSLAGEVA